MFSILISAESRFLINRDLIRKEVAKILAGKKIKSQVELSISFVGDRKMRALNKKYRQLEETTPVLSFSQQNGGAFVAPPDGILRLGDIVISYPQVVAMAVEENKLVDQVINELIVHGLKNLLGTPV